MAALAESMTLDVLRTVPDGVGVILRRAVGGAADIERAAA